MSKIAECSRGGTEGILVTDAELVKFATTLKKKCLDEIIPIPGMTAKQQEKAAKECGDHNGENARYWESTSGSHGWCCPECGTVTQWG